MVIVAIPLVAFMPWSGTPETEQYSGEPTALISPSPILTLAPETEETILKQLRRKQITDRLLAVLNLVQL